MAAADKDKSIANILVEIDGNTKLKTHTKEGEIDTFSGITVVGVNVDQRLDCPDMFTVDYELLIDMALTYIDSIKEGQEVKIQLGYGSRGDMEVVFTGEVSYIEPSFDPNGGTLTISGYDRSHRLTRGSQTRAFEEHDYTTVVDTVIGKSGANAGETSGSDGLAMKGKPQGNKSSIKYEHVPQLGMNNYQFIQSLGGDLGVSTDATVGDDKKISFREIDLSTEVVTLVRDLRDGTNPVPALSIRFRLSTVRQVTRVEVRGWDPKTKKNIVGVAEDVTVEFSDEGTKGPRAAAKALYGGSASHKLVIVDHPVASKDEADGVAQSILDKMAMEFITGEAEFEGVPSLRAGSVIAVLGYGDRFDGKYLVTSCQHIYQPGVKPYICRVEFQRNYVRD